MKFLHLQQQSTSKKPGNDISYSFTDLLEDDDLDTNLCNQMEIYKMEVKNNTAHRALVETEDNQRF